MPLRGEIFAQTLSLVPTDRNGYTHQPNFVVKSYINNWNEKTWQFIYSLADDESFHVVFITGHKKTCKNADSDVHAVRKGLTDN